MKNSVENRHSKKHMACREKYKALILKYVPYISKYMACIFYFSEHLKTNNLQKHKKQGFPRHGKRGKRRFYAALFPAHAAPLI